MPGARRHVRLISGTPRKLTWLEHRVTGGYERVPGQPSFHRVLVALYRLQTSN
ncbi:MAG: hypothetical protein QOH11_142 [Solirubrobacteraceae bacterium]|jgi:hypothetical protein|nr:hypothetical protein [Solirubrobacteraceae bacterium]